MDRKAEKVFWAKSNPPETIAEHTERLLQEYQKLIAIYPEITSHKAGIEKLLPLACVYHDWGKN